MTRTFVVRLIVAVVLALMAVLWYLQPVQLAANQIRLTLGDTTITADVVDNEVTREQGLSGRSGLTDEEGMLFVFQDDGRPAFWMKDMLFAIDMIWLSSDKKVVYIAQNATPQSYPTSFYPDTNSRYVLEVPSGWVTRHHVTVGAQAEW